MTAREAARSALASAIAARLERFSRPAGSDAVTQSDLAEQLELTQSRISRLLRADTEHFSIDRLIDIAERLDLNVRVSVTRPYTRS